MDMYKQRPAETEEFEHGTLEKNFYSFWVAEWTLSASNASIIIWKSL